MPAVWYRKGNEWICADVGEDYPFTQAEMIGMWRWIPTNVMRYWSLPPAA